MANFSALKTAIQNAIKQNGNEEITGDVLQQILLSIVSTMGDGAINTIEQYLSSETLARQGADNTLQSNIDAEALARGNADTQLQNAINAIKADIDNGYVYAGIAAPSSTPVSGKVFYIATAAGTYTNFGGQVLTQGINILRFNGSAWSSQQLIGIDDVPTAGSNKLVKSGGVQNELALGAVYDVSAKNPTGGPNNDGKWESLSELLSDANLNTLIPTAYRKGGMSIKFVQSSDNNYIQFRCIPDEFTTDVTKWQGVDDVPIAGSRNLVESGGTKELVDTTINGKIKIATSDVEYGNIFIDNNTLVHSQLDTYLRVALKDPIVLKKDDTIFLTDYVDKKLRIFYAINGNYTYIDLSTGIFTCPFDGEYSLLLISETDVTLQYACFVIFVKQDDKDIIANVNKSKQTIIEHTILLQEHSNEIEKESIHITNLENSSEVLFNKVSLLSVNDALIEDAVKGSTIKTTSISRVIHGKNKNICPRFENDSSNGITLVVDEDGVCTLNGTATDRVVFTCNIANIYAPSGSYNLQLNNPVINSDVSLRAYDASSVQIDNYVSGSSVNAIRQFTTNNGVSTVKIVILSGTVLNNFVIKPSLSFSNSITYAPSDFEIVNIGDNIYAFGTSDYILSTTMNVTYLKEKEIDRTLTKQDYAADAKETGDRLSSLENRDNNSKELTLDASGFLLLDKAWFEEGLINIIDNTITYVDNENRLRTKQDVVFNLKAGDEVSLSDYTNLTLKVVVTYENGTKVQAFKTSDFFISEYNSMAHVCVWNTDGTKTNLNNVISKLRICRRAFSDTSITKLNEETKETANVLSVYQSYFNAEASHYYHKDKRFTALICTDIHGDVPRMERYIQLLNSQKCFDIGISLGDAPLYTYAESNGAWYVNRINQSNKPFLTILGNHELIGDYGRNEVANSATVQQAFERFILSTKDKIGIDDLAKPYYKVDYSDYRISVIALNTYDNSDATEIRDGVEYFVEDRNQWNISQAQFDWFVSALNSVPENYHLIILIHGVGKGPTRDGGVFDSNTRLSSLTVVPAPKFHNILYGIVDAWQNGESNTFTETVDGDTRNVSCDFTQRGEGILVGYLCGHSHDDITGSMRNYPDQKVFMFATANLNKGETGSANDLCRTIHTKSEDCITSISVDTYTRKIYLVRFGADISIDMRERKMACYTY